MTDTARARKLADRIRVVVAETLQRRIKDPRLGYVTITDTRVTGDLREATVFYTVYGDDEERAASAAALESAKGVLRSEVGRQTGVRFTPTLAFVADALPDNARTIDDLLAKARAADEEVRKAATEAQYAGEADPYRKPAAAEDDDVADIGGDDRDVPGDGEAGPAPASGPGAASGSGSDSGPASDSGSGEGGSARA
jgi:ribosome-binding factor A